MISLIAWLLFGAFVGWIASMIMDTNAEQGAIANIIVGIIGAVVGGFLYTAFTGDEATSQVGEFLVALVGAVLVIGLWRALAGTRSQLNS